jgi:hypothetical protein
MRGRRALGSPKWVGRARRAHRDAFVPPSERRAIAIPRFGRRREQRLDLIRAEQRQVGGDHGDERRVDTRASLRRARRSRRALGRASPRSRQTAACYDCDALDAGFPCGRDDTCEQAAHQLDPFRERKASASRLFGSIRFSGTST